MMNVSINEPEIMDTDSILAILSVAVVSGLCIFCILLVFRKYIMRSCRESCVRGTRPHSGSDLTNDTIDDEEGSLTPLVV